MESSTKATAAAFERGFFQEPGRDRRVHVAGVELNWRALGGELGSYPGLLPSQNAHRAERIHQGKSGSDRAAAMIVWACAQSDKSWPDQARQIPAACGIFPSTPSRRAAPKSRPRSAAVRHPEACRQPPAFDLRLEYEGDLPLLGRAQGALAGSKDRRMAVEVEDTRSTTAIRKGSSQKASMAAAR